MFTCYSTSCTLYNCTYSNALLVSACVLCECLRVSLCKMDCHCSSVRERERERSNDVCVCVSVPNLSATRSYLALLSSLLLSFSSYICALAYLYYCSISPSVFLLYCVRSLYIVIHMICRKNTLSKAKPLKIEVFGARCL